MDKQLSFEDCFITRNRLRAKYGLVPLFDGDVIIPPNEIEYERNLCRYWQYYNASCKAKIPPKCYEEWKKKEGIKNGKV